MSVLSIIESNFFELSIVGLFRYSKYISFSDSFILSKFIDIISFIFSFLLVSPNFNPNPNSAASSNKEFAQGIE